MRYKITEITDSNRSWADESVRTNANREENAGMGLVAFLFWLAVSLVLLVLFFVALFVVIQNAVNESELAKDVRELKTLLERLAADAAAGGGFPDASRGAETAHRASRAEQEGEDGEFEPCPGCGQRVRPADEACPSCGLTLILRDDGEADGEMDRETAWETDGETAGGTDGREASRRDGEPDRA